MKAQVQPSARRARALVLGGGGVTGVAWELGVLAGLFDGGVDVRDAARIVGTSAGSVVGAQISSGVDLQALLTAQLVPPQQSAERTAPLDTAALAVPLPLATVQVCAGFDGCVCTDTL